MRMYVPIMLKNPYINNFLFETCTYFKINIPNEVGYK